MVDSERGVGRPEKALEVGRSVDRTTLSPATQVSLAIAMSGARLDLGSPELALGELEIPQLDPDRAFSYSPALYDAYAEVLDELGRAEDAALWRKRAAVALELLGEPDEGETVEIVEEDVHDVTPDAETLDEEPEEDASGDAPEEEALVDAVEDAATDEEPEEEDEDGAVRP